MINIGDTVQFIPGWNCSITDNPAEKRAKMISGKVTYVNRHHKQFCVKYKCGGGPQKETFKFSQIGSDVHVVGGRR